MKIVIDPKMPLVPRDAAVKQINHMFAFAHAVAFARIPHHHRLDADIFQRDEDCSASSIGTSLSFILKTFRGLIFPG